MRIHFQLVKFVFLPLQPYTSIVILQLYIYNRCVSIVVTYYIRYVIILKTNYFKKEAYLMQPDMEKIITSQLKTNALKSLFWSQNFLGSSEFSFECSQYTIDTFLSDRQSVLSFIQSLEESGNKKQFAAAIGGLIIETLQDINQFLVFDDEGRQAIADVYLEFMENIETLCLQDKLDADTITQAFRQHYLNIKDSLVSTNGTKVFEEYSDSPVISKKVCSEYTPQFQLEILHINPYTLSEPVLDLGCGRSGGLVKYLLSLGIDAYGADRNAEVHSNLIRQDWLSMEFEPGYWGTVISHMAFSNHFRHASGNGRKSLYADKYHDILRSLKPGGEFIYAPGLQEAEKEIKSTGLYTLRRYPTGDDAKLFSTKIKKLKGDQK